MSSQPQPPVVEFTDSDRMKRKSGGTTTATEQEDNEDECDSSFLFNKRRAVAVALAVMNEQADTSSSFQKRVSPTETSPVASSKQQQVLPPIVVQRVNIRSVRPPTIKPVVSSAAAASSSTSSCLTSKIDKIVDNLKQKQQQTTKPIGAAAAAGPLSQPPRVVAVVHDRHTSKMLLHQRILMSLRRQEKENRNDQILDDNDDNEDEDSSLTSLKWLNKYNLTQATGFQPISPPPTPPNKQQNRHYSYMSVNKTPLAKPVVNPFILKKTRGGNEDESDGCYSRHPHQSSSAASLLTMIRGIGGGDTNATTSKRSAASLRPPYSYSALAFLAIESSARKRLSVKEIYSWIIENAPYYGSVPSGSWKNSIRHNLATNGGVFCKVDKNRLAMRDFSGKGSLWCINPECRDSLLQSVRECGNDVVKLAEIKLLQDVHEIQSASSSNIGMRSSSASSFNSLPGGTSPSRLNTKGRFPTSLIDHHQPTVRINQRVAQKTKNKNMIGTASTAAYINPNIKSLTNVYKTSVVTNNNLNSGSNELDAVKALLTMKSRSISMPPTTTNTTEPSCSRQSGSRRKQLFKPPKRVLEDEDDNNPDDDNDDEQPFDEDDFLYSDSCDMMIQDDQDVNSSSDSTSYNSKSSGKLVVKFAFKSGESSSNSGKRKTTSSDNQQLVAESTTTTSNKRHKNNSLLELSHAASLQFIQDDQESSSTE